jgi:hypothetical protein
MDLGFITGREARTMFNFIIKVMFKVGEKISTFMMDMDTER